MNEGYFLTRDSEPDAERIRKLEKINRALMGRVERALDLSGGAFSLFQTAILLEDRVKARTSDLQQTLANLSDAYVRLEDARDDAEMARQNLTAAMEAVNEGFALFDAEEHLVMCNAPFRQLMPDLDDALVPGTPFATLAGLFARNRHVVLDASQSEEQWEASRLALFQRPYASFIQQFAGDRWLQISNRRMESGATVIFQTDITDSVRSERLRHERELDEQAKILRATIDQLPQGICMFSKAMQLKAWNRNLIHLLSLPIKMLTPDVSISSIFKAVSNARFTIDAVTAMRVAKWLENPAAHDLHDVEIVRSDGVILAVSSNSMPDGGVVVTFTDVTSERQATLALQVANETLEQRVEERTSELMREIQERKAVEVELLKAKEVAEEANKGKTRFLAAASHDLLQPLNASRIFLSLLLETELSPRQLRFADNADRAFGSVEQLLESLLDISRFESGSVETNVVSFPLDDILQTLVAEFQPMSDRKGLRLNYVPTTAWVKSDQGLLRRIIQNLLSNAIHYTEKGEVLLGARLRDGKVWIEVLDTGPGIPEDKQGLVFEEFRRLHGSSEREPKSMGLGLAIVDRIARLMGHEVMLRSIVGKGSCFSVGVAKAGMVRRDAALPLPAQRAAAITKQNPIVIVIENDMQILEGMTEILEVRHFHAIPTVSAEEALEALETLDRLPSLILADYHLDDGTGLDAIKRLRQACGRPVAAIMITANYTSALRAELSQLGIHFIGKPLRPAKLFEAIGELVQ
jgi:signal transduction histidine kinase